MDTFALAFDKLAENKLDDNRRSDNHKRSGGIVGFFGVDNLFYGFHGRGSAGVKNDHGDDHCA